MPLCAPPHNAILPEKVVVSYLLHECWGGNEWQVLFIPIQITHPFISLNKKKNNEDLIKQIKNCTL